MRWRANWTIGLLATICVVHGLEMVATFSLLDLVFQQGAGIVPRSEFADAQDRVDVMSELRIVAYIPTVILFLMWMYRASQNLQVLGAQCQRFSPSWAVGWWFVPIMNLFRPYQVMAEIWRGSEPSSLDGAASRGNVSVLLGWWWGSWVATGLVEVIAVIVWADGMDASPSSYALLWYLLASAFSIGGCVLAILVVQSVTSRQEEQYRRMTSG